MKQAGLTDRDFAKRCEISFVQVNRIRNGRSRPSVESAQKISEATGGSVTVAELLGLPSVAGVRENREPFASENAVSVNISVPSDLLALAQDCGLPIENILSERGLEGLRQKVKEIYMERNRAGIEWSRNYVRVHGTLAEQVGWLKRETQ